MPNVYVNDNAQFNRDNWNVNNDNPSRALMMAYAQAVLGWYTFAPTIYLFAGFGEPSLNS